jgi:NAD(P)-dependent dehydrogenase (short-subunit alcohol dehydrogenase family)
MPRVIVITGSSDGIGAAAARRLHNRGHTVVVVGRSADKTRSVADELGVRHFQADFASLGDVRRLAAELDVSLPRIDVLANNAGGVFGDRRKTVDGFERTFQVNYLGPFLLTRLLLMKLSASNATVLQTSSVGARMAPRLDLEDLNLDRNFGAIRAYNATKLENILFTKELHRRYHPLGISTAAFHPGNVATSFGTQSDSWLMKVIATNRLTRSFLLSPERGADQLVWLSESRPGVEWQSGQYYEKREVAKRANSQAVDPDLARDLWDRSEKLIGCPL